MRFVIVATLKRGRLFPPEPVSHADEFPLRALELSIRSATLEIQAERDPPLTHRQWYQEEASRHSYPRKLARRK